MDFGDLLPARMLEYALGEVPAEAQFAAELTEDFFDGIPGADTFLPGLVQAASQPMAVFRLDDVRDMLSMCIDFRG